MRTSSWGKLCLGPPVRGRVGLLALPFWLLLGGCSGSSTVAVVPPPTGSGSTVLDWTLSGTKDPAECAAAGAATFSVSLFGSGGGLAGTWVQSCSAFATTIDGLFPDTYTGRATLLDSGGGARTTTVSLAPFDVIATTTVTVAVDFPQSSFF